MTLLAEASAAISTWDNERWQNDGAELVSRLAKAYERLRGYGCPVCNGDCGGAVLIGCPMREPGK